MSNTQVSQTYRIQYLGSSADQRDPLCPNSNARKPKKIRLIQTKKKEHIPKDYFKPMAKPSVIDHQTPLLQPQSPDDILKTSCSNLLTWVGGVLAILLQFAAPGIAKGSCTHSRFTSHPISRFRRTAIFIHAVVHGTPDQKRLITSAIKKQHSFIKGPDYTASDPDLQKWTAATLFIGAITAPDALYSPSSPWRRTKPFFIRQEKELMCLAYGKFATALDMPEEMWPKCLDEFNRYYETTLKMFEKNVGEESKDLARILLNGEMKLPWFVKVWLVPVMRVLMTFWLPPTLRVAYGLPDPDGWLVWVAYVVVVWIGWAVNSMMPEIVKDWIRNWMKRDMERAAEDIRAHGRWMV
ncbi:hypothetical protein QBC38DRAFT_80970 [Podospora fimiseda]|uniref:ER-bound oxygenase mpaB/mpaB'/Rubber oxygenase catalytic domain-containing protein n=1 Tax=Podospora fimiseda TaxID=252190 RepID=A0AAN7BE74_9PEZI|nr:hypothetical protein QBC38DRAFT_80970 [Podospora fimiseda]